MEARSEALEFVKSHKECVIATASPDGKPEAATVLFAVLDDFTMYFGTDKSYRKYQNLLKNKNVAVVVGVDVKTLKTVQAEGKVEFLEGADDIAAAKAIFQERNPAMVSFFSSTLVFMRLKPTWLRYLNATENPEAEGVIIIP